MKTDNIKSWACRICVTAGLTLGALGLYGLCALTLHAMGAF